MCFVPHQHSSKLFICGLPPITFLIWTMKKYKRSVPIFPRIFVLAARTGKEIFHIFINLFGSSENGLIFCYFYWTESSLFFSLLKLFSCIRQLTESCE